MYFVLGLVVINIIIAQYKSVTTVILGKILDNLSPHVGSGFSWACGGKELLVYFIISTIMLLFYCITGIGSAKLIPWFAETVRGYYYKYILGHSYFYFSQSLGGDMVTKISSMTSSSIKILDYFMKELIPSISLLLATLYLFLGRGHQFKLTMLSWLAIHVIIYSIRLSKYMNLSMLNAKRYTDLMGLIGDVLNNIFAVKILYSVDFEKKYFDKYQRLDIDSFREMKLYSRYTEIILDMGSYNFFYSLLLMYQIITGYLSGEITFGEAVSVYNILRSLGNNIYRTLDGVSDLIIDISRCRDALKLLAIQHGVSDNCPEIELKSGGELDGTIILKDIFFFYKRDSFDPNSEEMTPCVFSNLNLTIHNNERVALVGPSGSGKSTLVGLILRLFDPIKGAVLLNGQDISMVAKDSLRNFISFIPQKQFLFNRTIFENIGYGCSSIRNVLLSEERDSLKFTDLKPEVQERIVDAARKAKCHDFIIKLNKGYDSIYGADTGLSGGQAQRIMIARAFVNKSSKFLILDEATSALDSETESFISESIDSLSVNRTVVMIAHKLKTVMNFDKIYVFDRGQIVEEGTHEGLLQLGGKYHQLWTAQSTD